MSTKTTFKRIALVAVAALGFGVLSVVPSQATVSLTTVTVVQQGKAATADAESLTAAMFTVSGLVDNIADTITVGMVLKSRPTGATTEARLFMIETTTASATLVSDVIGTPGVAVAIADSFTAGAATPFGIHSATPSYVGAKFGIQLDSTTAALKAGTYTYTVMVKSYSAGAFTTPVTQTQDITIVVAAAAAAKAAVAAFATAYIQEGTDPTFVGVLTDSVTAGSLVAGTVIGKIRVQNQSSAGVPAVDTITVAMTG